MTLVSTKVNTKVSTLTKVRIGSLLNLRANSETVFANDDRGVIADGTAQSIEAWFDYMNEEFDKLYEIYT